MAVGGGRRRVTCFLGISGSRGIRGDEGGAHPWTRRRAGSNKVHNLAGGIGTPNHPEASLLLLWLGNPKWLQENGIFVCFPTL